MHNYSVHDIPGYKNNILKSVGAVPKAILLLTIVQYLYQKILGPLIYMSWKSRLTNLNRPVPVSFC
jgi:hypothetical protein